MTDALLMVIVFILMEPVAALAHRYVFHGFAYGLHKGDHEEGRVPFWKVDYFPFAALLVALTVMGIGIVIDSFDFLIPVSFGMGAYGLCYFFIHVIVIHKRIRWFNVSAAVFRFHYDAHMLHHRFGGPPYGLLFPFIPKRLDKYFTEELLESET